MSKMLLVFSILCAFALTATAGNKPVGAARTVSGAFRTVYLPDDGSSTTLSTPPPFGERPVALLVPDDSPSGYTEVTATTRTFAPMLLKCVRLVPPADCRHP
jgi:hypothetical protein